MKQTRNEKLFLKDILKHCRKIERYTENKSWEIFLNDEILQDALIRNLEIIGEAAKNLTQKLREEHSQIPWRDVMRTQDKIVHHYFQTNVDTIWQTVTKDVPVLRTQIEKILEPTAKSNFYKLKIYAPYQTDRARSLRRTRRFLH